MAEQTFQPGDKIMSKIDNSKVYIVIQIIGDKVKCVDANNREHDIYLVAVEPYAFSGGIW
ncbi:hypothetical protein AB6735_14180 [Mucilaginibacter sp. RCC_168]|uniref:hypothetical protein n=1 Tax=Mucilaginibacter sp. RCC_168 TaxID=3239221 RepID=UPI00352674A1